MSAPLPRHLRRVATVFTLTFACMMLLVAPALARPLERSRDTETVSGTDEFCGEIWSVSGIRRETFMLKAGRHGDPTPYYFQNFHTRLTYTDPADADRGFVLSSNGVFKDIRIRLVQGTIYEFTTISVGHSSLAPLHGPALANDAGRVTWKFVIDTHGGSDLDQYELLDATMTSSGGGQAIPDPDEEYCELIAMA